MDLTFVKHCTFLIKFDEVSDFVQFKTFNPSVLCRGRWEGFVLGNWKLKPCWNQWINADSLFSNLKEWSSYFTSLLYFPPYQLIPSPNETVEAVHEAGSLHSFGQREIPTGRVSQQVSSSAFLCLFDFFHYHWGQNTYVNQMVQIISLLNQPSIYYSNVLSFLQCLHSQVLTRNHKRTTRQHVIYSTRSASYYSVNANQQIHSLREQTS